MLDETDYDVVVVGTGFEESVIAAYDYGMSYL